MRLLHYGIYNENTNKVTDTGCKLTTAKSKLDEMKKANPKNNYKIVHRWLSI